MNNKRIDFIDFSRAVALMAIILLHAAANYIPLWGKEGFSSADWLFANLVESFVRWGVPGFLIISGYLLANNIERFDPAYYLKRRILKVFVPFIVWSIIYAFWVANRREFFIYNPNWTTFINLVKHIPHNKVYSHLGFFYYYIPLCLIAPLVSCIYYRINRSFSLYIIYLWLIFLSLKTIGLNVSIFTPIFLFTGYLLVGKYLIENDLFSTRMSIIIGLASVATTAIGTYILTSNDDKFNGLLYAYTSVPTALIAISIIQLAKNKVQKAGWFIKVVSQYSLGIFFIHFMVLRFMEVYIVGMLSIPAALNIPIRFIFTLIVSLLITMILSKIKFIKFLVP